MSVPHRTHDLLAPVPHGFFGRAGGHSGGEFASLNASVAVGDKADVVARNRALAARTLGLAADALMLLRQVHSDRVVTVTEPFAPDARPQADALVTRTPGLVLGILTADCTPVLLADHEAGVIGAFHAGWRGAVEGVAGATVAAMAALGADPAHIRATIGPTISAANYEVGPEFTASLLARHPEAAPRITRPDGGREHFDLPGFVADRLGAAGVGHIADCCICTYANPSDYFSHRYATHKRIRTGRQIALIGLR